MQESHLGKELESLDGGETLFPFLLEKIPFFYKNTK